MSHAILWNATLRDPSPGSLDPDSPEPAVVRYLQVGRSDPEGFSGRILDYCGGGAWDDIWVLRGERLTPELLDLEEDDDDAYEEAIEAAYPGLVEAVTEQLYALIEWREGGAGDVPAARPALRAQARAQGADALLSNAPGCLEQLFA